MKITEKQILVLFDICKSAMNYSEKGFAGYSKEEIMKLLNNIISQQDEYAEISTKSYNDVEPNIDSFWL